MKTKKPKIMGILNTTPDSFYEKSRCYPIDQAIQRGIEMYHQGADILDVGGESTRPGSEPVSIQEELERTQKVVQALRLEIPIPISIDTSKPEVAEAAILAGATMINDISGLENPKMRDLAKEADVSVCTMHMQGSPKTMQNHIEYPKGVIFHIEEWFQSQTEKLIASGIKKSRIILDPGIGFGKTVAHNYEIIQNLRRFGKLGYPLLLGISRKSFMGKILNKTAESLLPSTLAVNTVAILQGIQYLRVHDVVEHRDIIEVLERSVPSFSDEE